MDRRTFLKTLTAMTAIPAVAAGWPVRGWRFNFYKISRGCENLTIEQGKWMNSMIFRYLRNNIDTVKNFDELQRYLNKVKPEIIGDFWDCLSVIHCRLKHDWAKKLTIKKTRSIR